MSDIDGNDELMVTPNRAELPEDVLIILPVRNLVLFPGVVLPVTANRDMTVSGAREALRTGRKIGFLLQKEASVDVPGPDDFYRVGSMATLLRDVAAPDGTHHLIAQGEGRFRVLDFQSGLPFLLARVEHLGEPQDESLETEARALNIKRLAMEAIRLLPGLPAEAAAAVQSIESPGRLADMLASFLDIKPAEKQEILETVELNARLDLVMRLLGHRVEVLRLQKEMQDRTQEAFDKRQKEAVLREQLRQIRGELGEDDDGAESLQELKAQVAAAGMPDDVAQQVDKELKRLERMPDAGPEHSMLRNWLELMAALPWAKLDPEEIEIARARAVLEADHYGLVKVKRRILEYLAVRQLNPRGKSPILCFVGPPGVGKTSLGQSIARAIGLRFQRASLGGIHDEAEIRGHRRTYIGALPGMIIQAIRKAGTRNPVLMLDEIDKLGHGIQGDPSAALLEVLDPEQNSTFRDNYLGTAFDLSRVMFIATANVLDAIPSPLRDRMEVIELTGYTDEEKFEIARRYLVARQLEQNGLDASRASISDDALHELIRGYTREAGCRNLEREIGAVLRSVAVRIAEGATGPQRVERDDLHGILGARKFESELAARTSVPGVATGLAWTPVGGDILFVEATRLPGDGQLILTGQLGDVMKESAQAAWSLVKSRAGQLGLDASLFTKSDVHVHVPAGAIPKDGPSAGVALYTALVSLFTGSSVRPDVAMTGEISLRGLVLPVGGIKEKIVAAARAGIHTVILPARNRKDLEDVPESARRALEFVFAERVDQAVAAAIGDVGVAQAVLQFKAM